MVVVLSFISLDSLSYCFAFNVSSTHPSSSTSHFFLQPHIFFFSEIWILCQNSLTRELKIRVVGFVLKKLFTHFEILIVSHVLHCVNGHYFFILSLFGLVNFFGLSVR